MSTSKRNQLQNQLAGSVLLAEDHDVTRFGMAQFLRGSMGVGDVEVCETFPQALEALASRPRDLAIFDLDLPGLNTPREPRDLERVRETYPAMKVVVMSGLEHRDYIMAALGARVHGYIPKRYPLPKVAGLLERVMAGEIYVPPSLAEPAAPLSVTGLVERQAAISVKELTSRQLEVLELMSAGLTNKAIGSRLGLSESTIKIHAHGLFQSLGVRKRAQAVDVGQPYLNQRKLKLAGKPRA